MTSFGFQLFSFYDYTECMWWPFVCWHPFVLPLIPLRALLFAARSKLRQSSEPLELGQNTVEPPPHTRVSFPPFLSLSLSSSPLECTELQSAPSRHQALIKDSINAWIWNVLSSCHVRMGTWHVKSPSGAKWKKATICICKVSSNAKWTGCSEECFWPWQGRRRLRGKEYVQISLLIFIAEAAAVHQALCCACCKCSPRLGPNPDGRSNRKMSDHLRRKLDILIIR